VDQYTLEQIYQMLMSSTFEEWYYDSFTGYVTGEINCTKEQMLTELKDLL
jgi:hypothetical protein